MATAEDLLAIMQQMQASQAQAAVQHEQLMAQLALGAGRLTGP